MPKVIRPKASKKLESRRKKTQKEQKLEKDSIKESRRMLAIMLACAAASWKSGISFQELMMEAHKSDTSPETFWLERADTEGTMIYMLESDALSDMPTIGRA